MVGSSPNPTVRRVELAARLRRLRIAAGRSVEDAARELMCSPAKISRMETGGRGVQPRDVRDLCRFYGVPDDVRDELMQFAIEARRPGWWHDLRTFDEQTMTYVGLEQAAETCLAFQLVIIPGLFQTPEYTRAMLAHARRSGELRPDWIEETAAARVERQKRVHSGEFTVHAILDEAALRRPVGDAQIMRTQLDRLLEDSARPNVTIQVIPFDRGVHPGVDGPFLLLSFRDNTPGDVAYLENLIGNVFNEKPTEVDRYRHTFATLSDQFALTPPGSVKWLAKRRAEIRDTPLGTDTPPEHPSQGES
jgi:transcriptional regulator with XRE-family HTH domain